jgi:hypothetical protein
VEVPSQIGAEIRLAGGDRNVGGGMNDGIAALHRFRNGSRIGHIAQDERIPVQSELA